MFRYYITLFILWIILSGRFECFFIASGVLSCLFTVLLCQHLSDICLNTCGKSDKTFLFRFVFYIGWLILQITLSCLYVAKKIWQLPFNPQTVIFESQQKNIIGLALFVNSVTLTPGTVSVDLIHEKPYKVVIFIIDEKLIDNLNDIDHKVAQLFRL